MSLMYGINMLYIYSYLFAWWLYWCSSPSICSAFEWSTSKILSCLILLKISCLSKSFHSHHRLKNSIEYLKYLWVYFHCLFDLYVNILDNTLVVALYIHWMTIIFVLERWQVLLTWALWEPFIVFVTKGSIVFFISAHDIRWRAREWLQTIWQLHI